MATIQRYGPSMQGLEVTPRPQVGQGSAATFEAFEGVFQKANDFLRPEVVRHVTAAGEAGGIDSVEATGPEFGLEQTQAAGSSSVEVIPGRPGAGMAPTVVNAAIMRASQENGVNPLAMRVIAQIESTNDPSAQNPDSSAGGLFQQIDDNAAHYGVQDRFDPYQSASGAARMMRDNIRSLTAVLGREPTVGELYLAHQQGTAGAPALLRDRNALASSVVGIDAVRLNGGSADMTAGEFADIWIDKGNRIARELGGSEAFSVNVPTQAEYELRVLNQSTFEPRAAFTVRDQAFNAAADRVIQTRAMVALDQGIAAAQQRANGDLEVLNREMGQVREMILGQLPEEMPGLRTALEDSFERSQAVAQRQAIDLQARRIVAEQETAATAASTAIRGEAERLALTGAGGSEIAAHMTNAQAALAQFGPREGFTLNGQYYPPDPTRAGNLSVAAIGQQLGAISNDTRRVMIEAEFERSAAPGQFVEEFRRQVMSGNSPLPAGESLTLMRQLEGRVRATESARRTEANAARALIEQQTDDRINAFVELTEAGVPTAIPQEDRQQILDALSPYPELQREALEQFAVADAAVVTFGMSGPELLAYVGVVRDDIVSSVERGELDLEGVAIIQSLEDRVKKVQDAVSAEMIGLPMIEQLAMDGATADQVDYDALREQAAGNADVIGQINEVEAFHRDIEQIRYMSGEERDAALEGARRQLSELAATGSQFGAEALMTQRVVDRLEEWSNHMQGLAESDPVKFAQASGIELQSFEGVASLVDAGSVIAGRIAAVQPATMSEGVNNPVPLSRSEVDALSEIFQTSPRGARMEFIASISGLGRDQADAVFARLGAAEPTLFAAGQVYTNGNQEAASVILRGSNEIALEGGGRIDIASARASAIGVLMEENMITDDSIERLDTVALAYARGLAIMDGGRAIALDDIEDGFKIATGRQADGSGGVVETRFGSTILPPGWSDSNRRGRSIETAMMRLDDAQLSEIAGGDVTDADGRKIGARELLRSIEGLRPLPDDPAVLVPLDYTGAVFLVPGGFLQFDLNSDFGSE